MRKLTDAFMEMVACRLEDISTEMVASDPVNKTVSSEIMEAQRELINTFPDKEPTEEFYRYESACGAEEGHTLDVVYKQAFQDGMEFMQGFMFETAGKNTQVRSAAGGVLDNDL